MAFLKGEMGSTTVGAGWDEQQQGEVWGSPVSWVHGGCSERLRQNCSPSDCDQPTRGKNMSSSTTFRNRKTSKESAQTLSAR